MREGAWTVSLRPRPQAPPRSVPTTALPRALLALVLLVQVSARPAPARADIFAYTSRDGVTHFTNIPQPGKPWRRLMRTGPGRAAVVHARRRSGPVPAARVERFEEDIQHAAALYQIPATLIHAVIAVESAYDSEAVSRVGAQGLMQLMPSTARGMGVANAFDPRQNIFGGVRYLRVLANQFAGSLLKTLAGYHAGAGAVLRYNGLPPYATTHQYVRMVFARYRRNRQRALATALPPAAPTVGSPPRASPRAAANARRDG